MSIPSQLARELEDLAHELDMIVFRLERGGEDVDKLVAERKRVRRELEKMRDRLRDLSLGM